MPVSLESVPASLRGRVGPDAPDAMRMMIARAMVPMGPEDLFTALSFLASTDSTQLGKTARSSLQDIPRSVVHGVVAASRKPDLLDFALIEYFDDDSILQSVILNTAVADHTLIFAAKKVHGKHIEMIGNNQERVCRLPALVEAIYYNPEAPMAVVNRVFETAVRSRLSLNHIPGYKQIYQSIFGRDSDKEPGIDVDLEFEELTAVEVHQVIDDDAFTQALVEAARQESESDDTDADKKHLSLHAMIADMTVPQKVRMALVGNAVARSILVKDGRQIVCVAVLQNPALTEKEIAGFAKNKAIPESIIQVVCRNREWTKNPNIQLSLISHPKTPAVHVNRWIRNLNKKRLGELSRSREVPGYVSRLAKNILSARSEARVKRSN